MIKKLIIVGAVVALLVFLVVGPLRSYSRVLVGHVRQSAREAVPIEFEIERARGMIKDLVPEVRKNMHVIAKEEVEVKRLQEQIAEAQARLEKEKSGMLRLNADLKTGKNKFQYAGCQFSAEQVKNDLANRFDRYKTGEATLGSLQQILAARQQSLNAARQKLEGMLAEKRRLKVEVENLEARLQMIAAAKTTSQYEFDDSRLGQVKELITNLRTRLDVAERLVNAETHIHDEIPLDEAAPENIVDQVTEYFSEEAPAAEAVAAQ